MFQKILFIPRAVADLLKVLLYKKISFAERWNIAKALGTIKIASLSKKINDHFVFDVGKWKINALYNKDVGFLVKEIFVEEVYALKRKQNVFSILDLGSNIGLSIAYFKLCFPQAIIEAYEPDKNSFQLLQKNVIENKWSDVTAHEVAVNNENGFLFGELKEDKASVNSNFSASGDKENNKVPAKDIAEILQQNFDVTKMDIEGGEWAVLKKIMEEGLITKSNNWFVEFHEIEENKEQFQEILNCFKKQGYKSEERKEVVYFYKNI